jgi:hypothetical protein
MMIRDIVRVLYGLAVFLTLVGSYHLAIGKPVVTLDVSLIAAGLCAIALALDEWGKS